MDISPYFYIQVFFFKRRSILSKILNDVDFEPSFIYKKKIFKEVLTIQRKAACGRMTNTDA